MVFNIHNYNREIKFVVHFSDSFNMRPTNFGVLFYEE